MVASKEMNLSEFRKIFTEEFNFISEAFSRCQWPKPVESDGESDSDESEAEDKDIDESDNEIKTGEEKLNSLKENQNRAGTIKELLEKHEQIRSKENRKRKKEEPKKSKHKIKKKKKKSSDENSTNLAKPPVNTDTTNKVESSESNEKEEVKSNENEEVKSDEKEEVKDEKPKILKRTRAPIRHGADVIVNEEGSMLFSKLAFTDSINELKPQLGGPKQPKHVLGKLEKVNKLISSLEERGKTEKAQRLKENMSWSNAFNKAEGAKVKDNTYKVKQSVKQLAKRKRASERKWKKRLDDTTTKKEKKEKKREQHIQKRVDQKKERKLKKLIKRGRFIPELKTKPSK